MTISAAIAKGYARPVSMVFAWYASCPTCNWRGPRRDYKGPASHDARDHNEEVHRA